MLDRYEMSLSAIRSEIDHFLQASASTSGVSSLQSDLLSQFPDMNSAKKDELYAWIPKPTLLCPSELNTTASFTCNTMSCDSSNNKKEKNDLEKDQDPSSPRL